MTTDRHISSVPSRAEDVDASVADLRAEVQQLHRAMESRAHIEQAKGVLMLHYGISADRAFAVLRRWSSVTNVKLHLVADMLVELAEHRAALETCGGLALTDIVSEALSAPDLTADLALSTVRDVTS